SPGARELITDGVTGLLFTGSSPAEIAAARERALGLSPEARARIVAAAYRLARGEFHPQRAASELFAIYNRAACPPKTHPRPLSRGERGGSGGRDCHGMSWVHHEHRTDPTDRTDPSDLQRCAQHTLQAPPFQPSPPSPPGRGAGG